MMLRKNISLLSIMLLFGMMTTLPALYAQDEPQSEPSTGEPSVLPQVPQPTVPVPAPAPPAQNQPSQTSPPPALQRPDFPPSISDSANPAGNGEDEPGLRMNFRDASLDDVLEYLSERAGLVVIKTVDVTGRVTVFSRQELDVYEAIDVLNTVLKEQGYAAIKIGRTLKIVDFDDAVTESIPVRRGGDPDQIPENDVMVTQIIPVRYGLARDMVDDLDELLPSYAVITANVRSNSIILTDTSANIRRMARIIAALDTSIADQVDIRVFHLIHADARDAARLVTEMFGESGGSGRGGGGNDPRQMFMRAGRGGGEVRIGQAEAAGPNLPVKASYDERTNHVVVAGPPDTLNVVEKMLKELDKNDEAAQDVFIYKVQNNTADQLAETLNNLFDENAQSGGAFGRRGNQRGGRNNMPAPATNTGDGTNLSGQVHVVPETDTNSLLVMTASKNFDRVRAIIEELDYEVPQVMIKVLIVEVTHDRNTELGVEWTILNDENSGMHDLFTDFGVNAMPGGLFYRLTNNNFSATLRAMERDGKVDVLSRPYITALENQESQISVGQRVPFIRNSSISDAGRISNTVEYEDIGIILTVTPHINPQGLVVMDVSQTISSITDSSIQISDTVFAPIYSNREATARVAIADGQTIVIGGLMQDQLNETVRKVPLLGDIPFLGELFKSTNRLKTKTELLVFITPHVATSRGRLQEISDAERAGMKITPNAVEPGMFEEHLRGLQRGSIQPMRPETAEEAEERRRLELQQQELLEEAKQKLLEQEYRRRTREGLEDMDDVQEKPETPPPFEERNDLFNEDDGQSQGTHRTGPLSFLEQFRRQQQ